MDLSEGEFPKAGIICDVDTVSHCGVWRCIATGVDSRTRLICASQLPNAFFGRYLVPPFWFS